MDKAVPNTPGTTSSVPASGPRGLSALLQRTTNQPVMPAGLTPSTLPLVKITTNPDQPRRAFDEEAMQELMASIRVSGLLQPVIVKTLPPEKVKDGIEYMLVAGERRFRAFKLLGRTEIPALVKVVSTERDLLLLSLVENIQRTDLNPMEEARAFRALHTTFAMSQEQISQTVGKSRTLVTNLLRINDAVDSVQAAVEKGELSAQHAVELASIDDKKLQTKIASKCIAEGLTVKQLRGYIRGDEKQLEAKKIQKSNKRGYVEKPPHIVRLEQNLRRHFGTRVNIVEAPRKGKIVIEFYSVEDFDRITKLMGVTKE